MMNVAICLVLCHALTGGARRTEDSSLTAPTCPGSRWGAVQARPWLESNTRFQSLIAKKDNRAFNLNPGFFLKLVWRARCKLDPQLESAPCFQKKLKPESAHIAFNLNPLLCLNLAPLHPGRLRHRVEVLVLHRDGAELPRRVHAAVRRCMLTSG